jgi:alpha-galactosidase
MQRKEIMTDLRKLKFCYIGGGSRNWAWVLIKDLALEKEISGTIHLYDIDAEAAKANEIIGNKVMAAHNPERFSFTSGSSLEKALSGSDFVFISILPGDFEEMAVDVHAPEKYGIWQPVGDTVGAGGLNRALRTIPMIEEIAGAVAKYAPNAWVLNYTNPMSICTRTLYEVFPAIKAFGCCHEVFNTQKLLMEIVIREGLAKKDEIKREDIITNVTGINHFTFVDRASWRDIDLFPLWDKFIREFGETGFPDPEENHPDYKWFTSGERVKMDLSRRFGLMAAAGDRHLAEFCPPSWYLKDPDTARSWKFRLTPVDYRVSRREKLKEMSAAYCKGSEALTPQPSGEEGLRLVKALLGLDNMVTNVNLPNKGQMPGFPEGAVVETNAFFSRNSVQPLITRGQPNPLSSLTLQHIVNQEGIVKAALARDLEAAFRVFLNDPQLRAFTPDRARELFKEMTSKTIPAAQGYSGDKF